MIRILTILLVLVASATAHAADLAVLKRCLEHETAVLRLACLDAAVADTVPEEGTDQGDALLICVAEPDSLERLDCFTEAIGPRAREEAPAVEGRAGVDFRLPDNYQPGGQEPDCTEEEIQTRHATSTRKQGEAGIGAGVALTISGAVLGAIAAGVAESGTEPDLVTGLAISGAALGTGGGVAFGAGGTYLQMSWVHTQLARMESRRCGGAVSIERR